MIVGSIKENTALEKRVSLTPETAKNIIGLGLKVCIEKGYALHLGFNDDEYKNIGVEIKNSSTEVFNSSNLVTKVNCPSDDEISILKDNLFIDYLKDYNEDIMINGAKKFIQQNKNRRMCIVTSCNKKAAKYILTWRSISRLIDNDFVASRHAQDFPSPFIQ